MSKVYQFKDDLTPPFREVDLAERRWWSPIDAKSEYIYVLRSEPCSLTERAAYLALSIFLTVSDSNSRSLEAKWLLQTAKSGYGEHLDLLRVDRFPPGSIILPQRGLRVPCPVYYKIPPQEDISC